jgi:tetratricopeptide (TPR) repeat protein
LPGFNTYKKAEHTLIKVVVLVIFFVMNIHWLFATAFSKQVQDSLLKTIKTSTGIEKVDALNQLSENSLIFSIAEAGSYAQQALKSAQNIKYNLGIAKAYENLALTDTYRGEFHTAIETIEKSIRIYKQLKEYESLYRSLLRLAGLYQYLNNNTKVIETYLQAMNMATENSRLDQQATVSQSLSNYFITIGDYNNAKFYVSKALLYAKMSNKPDCIGLTHCAMADYYSAVKQSKEALSYYHSSLQILASCNETGKISMCLVRLGNHLVNNLQYDSALVYYSKALELNILLNDVAGQANVYTSRAHVYQQLKQLNKALKYQKMALKLRQDYGHISLIGSSFTNIGTVYTLLTDYPKALYYFNEGLKIARKTHRTDYVKFNYQRIYDLYIAQKDYQKALEYNNLISVINDSILKNESQQKYSEYQDKYENEKKLQNIDFLTRQNEIQKLSLNQIHFTIYILIAALVLLFIIGILLFYQSKLNTRHRQMELEQKLLRSQMNPHFIFNALIAIQSFIFKNESSEAAHYITSFARLIRLVLSNSREEFVSLQREIDTLSNYLSLQKMRFDNKFEYSLIVDPNLETEIINIPPMLAQPFVENAIENGVYGMGRPGKIVLSIREEDTNILIEVIDDGIGHTVGDQINLKSGKSQESPAMRITEERIANLNRKYQRKIRLQVLHTFDEKKQPNGTKVLLIIPEHEN